jgi:hypothetical protein
MLIFVMSQVNVGPREILGKHVKVFTSNGLEEFPLRTFSPAIPRCFFDEIGNTYLGDVNGIRLRSLNGLKASPHFMLHVFNGGQDGDFVAIEIRRSRQMKFVSKPYEICAALRELECGI